MALKPERAGLGMELVASVVTVIKLVARPMFGGAPADVTRRNDAGRARRLLGARDLARHALRVSREKRQSCQ